MKLQDLAVMLGVALTGLPHGPSAPIASRDVEIVGRDYAFETPTLLAPGRTNFRFINKGKVVHELNIALLKKGETVDRMMAAANAGKPVIPYIDGGVGVLFASPGKRSTSALVTELLPGRVYVVRCILKDSTTAPRHQAMGMYSAIRIRDTSFAPASLHVDTVVGMDYAFRYSRDLGPGVHHFAFVNVGKQRHEMSMALLKRGVTLDSVRAVDAAGGDAEKLFDKDFGLLHALGGTPSLGLLRVNLEPGREYTMVCGFSDDEKSKPHYMLGMFGSIRVRKK